MWMGMCVVALVVSIATTNEVPFAQRECEREISERREGYTEAYEQEMISGDLYEEVINFLDDTQNRLSMEDCVEVYGDFPDDYVGLLIRYSETAMNVLGDGLQEAKDEEAKEELKRLYNADMYYIERELLIYGEKVRLQLSEKEFEEQFPMLKEESDIRQGGIMI